MTGPALPLVVRSDLVDEIAVSLEQRVNPRVVGGFPLVPRPIPAASAVVHSFVDERLGRFQKTGLSESVAAPHQRQSFVF
jgi:hypothetical protein